MTQTVVVQNHSTLVKDSDLIPVITALQLQVPQLANFWPSVDPNTVITFIANTSSIPVGAWPLFILDTSDQAGALGYHDFDKKKGPFARVFARDTLAAGLHLSVTMSHELCELLPDPNVTRKILVARRSWMVEPCDPCEADQYGYLINGVLVSDFVTPDYYSSKRVARFDFMNYIKKPLSLLPGGYVSYKDNTGWHQLFADKEVTRPGSGGRSKYRHEQFNKRNVQVESN